VRERNTLAHLHARQGQYAKALTLLQQALEAVPENSNDRATVLGNLAQLHYVLGRDDLAEPLLQEALRIREENLPENHPDLTYALNNLAVLYESRAEHSKAEPLLRKAWAIWEKGREHPDMASVLSNLAAVCESQKQYDEAQSLLQRALEIQEKTLVPEHPDIASSLSALAMLHMKKGQRTQAEQLYQQALPIAVHSENPEIKWTVLGALSDFYAESNPNLAIFFGKQAVNTLQGVRAANVGLGKAMQQSFLKSRESFYTGLADLLFAQGRLAEGEQVLAMLKESEYHDFIERSATQNPKTTRATFTAAEKKQLARSQEMSGRVVAMAKEYDALKPGNLSEAEKARKEQLREQLNLETKKFTALCGEMARDFAAMGTKQGDDELDPKDIERLSSSISPDLKELGHGAVLLSYLAAKERLWIVLTTAVRGTSVAREVNIKREELNKKIAAFRTAITNRDGNVKDLGRELHGLLIAPVAEDLQQTGAQTLMLNLSGTLRYLPFAALHDGENYLAKRYALAVFTEAAKTKLKDPPQAQWRFAGFGVTQKVGDLPALPAVREELEGIRENALQGSALYDEDFNAGSLRDTLEQSPPVVHVASHFVFEPGTQRDSYLLLGDGTHLALNTVHDEYRFDGVDLVALSACQTAMGGDKEGAGREVEGLGVTVQDLGDKSALATLWKVDDGSTGQFMQLFYSYRQRQG
ncbi:MAG: CHAT domain-containing protein, partial [Deltaproteobacteria bacterium]|nr:CHAT domain-containing protein [Deltaproteobacteria bacterium]